MTTRIAKWGNSLGLRLSKTVAQEAELAEGDRVEVSVSNGTILVRPSRRTYALEELVSQISAKNRHDESGWRAPAGREAW